MCQVRPQLTCFTGTKVQILTDPFFLQEERGSSGADETLARVQMQAGAVKALLELYEGSMKALLRFY